MRDDDESWFGALAILGWSGLSLALAAFAAWSALRRWEPTLSKGERATARDELREVSDPLQALGTPDRPPDAWRGGD
jgi:hypothetical protein